MPETAASHTRFAVVGAGLAGTLQAILLAQRGYTVDLYEARRDMRQAGYAGGRSINLALSQRGIRGLARAGIADTILEQAIPMHSRAIHSLEGQVSMQAYGKDDSYYINSVSRGGLNEQLLHLTDRFDNLQVHFEHSAAGGDPAAGKLAFQSPAGPVSTTADVVIGADGAGSAIRASFRIMPGFHDETEWLSAGYKELRIPPSADGGFQLEKYALHIWPRGAFMLIALPNPDGSFTCTLFLDNEGEESFAALDSDEKALTFFERYFADALALMPDFLEQWHTNPASKLGTLRCAPWTYGRAVLTGDAAHAIVPFYGQGMNAGFEDCVAFMDCLDTFGPDWGRVLQAFAAQRKPNGDAIAELALQNFIEMRDLTADPVFQQKRQLELELERRFPDRYLSKYALVTFSPDIPYAEAKRRGDAQDAWLMQRVRELNGDSVNYEQELERLEAATVV